MDSSGFYAISIMKIESIFWTKFINNYICSSLIPQDVKFKDCTVDDVSNTLQSLLSFLVSDGLKTLFPSKDTVFRLVLTYKVLAS